jgi:hypothetical protein
MRKFLIAASLLAAFGTPAAAQKIIQIVPIKPPAPAVPSIVPTYDFSNRNDIKDPIAISQLKGTFECYAASTDITRIVQIDENTNQVRFWVKLQPTLARSVGPFYATITPRKITWAQITTRGRASSTTTYTLDRQMLTFNIHIIYNDFMDMDPWDNTSPCKTGLGG